MTSVARLTIDTSSAEEDMQKLIKKCQAGDENALELLIAKNRNLICSIINDYVPNCDQYEREDLFQEGLLGLQAALNKYSPDYETQFSTYAYYHIFNAITKYAKNNGLIHFPKKIIDTMYRVRKFIDKYKDIHNGRHPSDEEICNSLHITAYTLSKVYLCMQETISLDNKPEDCNYEYQIKSSAPEPEDTVIRQDLHTILISALKSVTRSERDYNIMVKRYGLDGNEPMTLVELGNQYKLSTVGVSKIEKRILSILRESPYVTTLSDFVDILYV